MTARGAKHQRRPITWLGQARREGQPLPTHGVHAAGQELSFVKGAFMASQFGFV